MLGSNVSANFWMSEYLTPWTILVHGVTKVLTYKQTPYQEMYIVETGAYGKALVLDGKVQSCTEDEFLYHEALVQPAMCLHSAPRRVLILGGGEGATAREALRWKTVEKVVMVDIDADVVNACKEHLPEMHQNSFNDPRFELIIGDALEVLKTVGNDWDLVISDLADPIEEGPAFQLFTKEFFESISQVLAPGGFYAMQAGPVAPQLLKIHARLMHTLKSVFTCAHSYASFAACYGTPWGFAIANQQQFSIQPDPGHIDLLLSEKTTGSLQMLDGNLLRGMLQMPVYLQNAIAQETEIYTMATPPKFLSERG